MSAFQIVFYFKQVNSTFQNQVSLPSSGCFLHCILIFLNNFWSEKLRTPISLASVPRVEPHCLTIVFVHAQQKYLAQSQMQMGVKLVSSANQTGFLILWFTSILGYRVNVCAWWPPHSIDELMYVHGGLLILFINVNSCRNSLLVIVNYSQRVYSTEISLITWQNSYRNLW